jgi:putative ABC transport system permease protein
VRLAVANIHRPGALTPSVVLSLGLGLALLVTVIEIDGNLHREFAAALPEQAPSFFFLDIPAAGRRRVRRLRARAGAGLHARTRADAARPHRRGERHQGGGP